MKKNILIVLLMMGTFAFSQHGNKGKDQGNDGGKSHNKGGQQQDKGGQHHGGDKHQGNHNKGKDQVIIHHTGNGKKGGKGNDHVINGKPHGNNKGHKGNHGFNDKGHKGYGHHKGHYSGRNFGQARSYEARTKHNKIKYTNRKEYLHFYTVTRTRNYYLFSETDLKLKNAIVILNRRRDEGTLVLVDYNRQMNMIELYQKRRLSLEVRLG